MRPSKTPASGSGDLFRARLDQIINMRHELVRLADEIDWEWIDGELADLYRPAVATRFMVGLLFLKHIYALSDEGRCERWVHDPYFRYFTGEAFFRHELPHDRSGMTHWRQRIGDRLDKLLAETQALTGREVERVYVDKGYRGHDAPKPLRVYRSLKTDGHLARNCLKGRHGDHANAVLTAVGYNLRLILNWLRILCAKILDAIYDACRRIFASHHHIAVQI